MTSKIKFFARLLVITLFSTFISCSEELYNIKDQHNGVDKNNISLALFKNETNIGKVEIILSVPSKTSIASKSKSQVSDFVIDTLAIKRHISTDDKKTYTFRIYPLHAVAQQNEIYNLVHRKMNNKWETYIFYLKKLPQEDSEHKIFEKIERIQGGKIINALTSKSSTTGDCSYETFSVHCDGSCAREGYSQCDGFACPTGQCLRRSITYLSCELGGGGGGTYDPSGPTGGGGGGSSNPSNTSGSSTLEPFIYSPNDFDNPAYNDPNYINEVNKSYIWANLGAAAQTFFESNLQNLNYFNETIQYQIDNNWSSESYEFTNWAREFKFENPDVTWVQFENWFMGDNPQKDGEENIEPNLITFETPVTLGTLPSFNDFINAFPKNGTYGNYSQMSASDVYNLVKGTLLNSYINEPNKYSNGCSIRGSRGLLYSNITIPVLKYNGLQRTQKGGDLKNYILDAVSFNTFMKAKFGEAQNVLTGADANDPVKVADFLKGKNGIYVIVNNDPKKYELGGAGYSGHVDTIINGICIGKAYTRPQGGVKSIKIWSLN